MKALVADFRLALLLLRRSRLLGVAAILGILIIATAWLSAQFSPRQPATVALDLGISFIRLVVPLLVLLQIQDLLAREVERRQIFTSLTYPRSRSTFLLARYGAVIAAAGMLIIVLALLLVATVIVVSRQYDQATKVALGAPYAITLFFIFLDVAVVGAFAVMVATVATTPNLVLLTGLGFMIAARSASTIMQLLEREHDLLRGADWYHQSLQGVQWVLPDLGAFDVRTIALYGKMEFLPQTPWALVVAAVGYIALLLSIGCFRFERRQFA